jgi:hypothetical protein
MHQCSSYISFAWINLLFFRGVRRGLTTGFFFHAHPCSGQPPSHPVFFQNRPNSGWLYRPLDGTQGKQINRVWDTLWNCHWIYSFLYLNTLISLSLSVTGPPPERWARDEVGLGWFSLRLWWGPRWGRPAMIFTPGLQADQAQDELGRPPREGMTIEVPNITNAVEVSKFCRGPEMKSIGVWTLAVSTPQCAGDYQGRVTDSRRL